MHTGSFGSFRIDSTVDAVIRSKRVVQSVSANLTNLLQKIAREDATFRVIVQEALKMKRDSPDQFLFETFDECVRHTCSVSPVCSRHWEAMEGV